ncbi:MAG: peptide ABC transporter substrate-binding protein [Planctomycetota bacterium]
MAGGTDRLFRAGAALVLLGALSAALLLGPRAARLPRADLVANNGAEVRSLDPQTVSGVAEGRAVQALYEGLTALDPATLAPRPAVAERWEVTEDGRTYTFHLRPEACWIRPGTDPARFGERGDPVTAADFVRSWERLLHPATAAEYAYELWCVKGARQYTLLPEDRLYASTLRDPVWVAAAAGGRQRLGLTGHLLAELDGASEVAALRRPGDALAAGDPFAAAAGREVAAPIGGRIVAVNPALPAGAAALAADPYGAGWIAEIEASPAEAAAARAAGRLVDAAAYRRGWVWPHQVGLRAADPRTLVVELATPTPHFLALTALHPLYPVHLPSLAAARKRWPDAWETEWVKPEHLVTNGPYRLLARRLHDRLRLAKSPVYWDAAHVAMRTVDLLAVEHQGTALNLYLTGEADWIAAVPANLVPHLAGREDFRPAPQLGTYFFRVNVTRPPLDDARVRRALALSIDRRAISAKVLKGGQLPSWSFLPPGFPGYARAEIDHAPAADEPAVAAAAFAADCARARELLAAAGFPGGAGLRPLEIAYNTAEVHRDVAEVIADGWRRELGLEVCLANQEFQVFLDTQRTLDYDVSRSSWMGDFLDPVNFLAVFRAGGANNRTGWASSSYDELLDRAAREPDGARRLALLAAAERILMDEVPILPLFTYVTQNLVNPRLGGFSPNVLDTHPLHHLYWMDDAELARRRAADPPAGELAPAPGPREGLHPPAGRSG